MSAQVSVGSPSRLVVAGGEVVDPAAERVARADVLIEEGVVRAIDRPGAFRGTEAQWLDAGGCLVTPGLIDIHVHLREPGYEYKETIATGTAAAAAGGFAAVACMANTNPPNDNAAVTRYIRERAAAGAGVRVYPIGALSQGLRGEVLAEIGEMHRAGIVAVSDDGNPVGSAALMRRALEYCRMFGLPVVSHAEDPALAAGGVMNEGLTSLRLGLSGVPAAAEEIMVSRDIALAALTRGRLHIAHVSTAGAVAAIREAKARGVAVTAEVTPHHLFLTEEAVEGYATNAKVKPPLRTAADVAALRAGLADGTIDVIASDHAPHHRDEKEVEFDQAASGVVGLETTLALALGLVREGVLPLARLVARLTLGPARALGLRGGQLAPGEPADVTIIDPGLRWRVRASEFRSKGRNTPFDGWEVVGRAVAVLVGGRVVAGGHLIGGARRPERAASRAAGKVG